MSRGPLLAVREPDHEATERPDATERDRLARERAAHHHVLARYELREVEDRSADQLLAADAAGCFAAVRCAAGDTAFCR